ncbi:M23 family metallopeptidase [Dyella tabacisoli]|nr:M23 family metallopeptidase [Dyella tabacisoli]
MSKVILRRILIALLLACGAGPGMAQQRTPLLQSFDLQVPWNPSAVDIAGKTQLVYELHLTNFARNDLVLKRIQTVNIETGAVLGDFHESELQGLIGRPDRPGEKKDRLIVAPGARAVAYLSLPIDAKCANPCRLMHLVEFVSDASAEKRPASVKGGAITVRHQPMPILGPPLRGGPWVAVYDSSWERGHRRVLYAVDGAVHIPGRFAIDWIKIGGDGKYATGDASNLSNWPGYGVDVLAVADATVAAAQDDILENATVNEHASTKVAPENASGNYVSLDLGHGHFVFYEHLKPGSIKVRPGELVQRGQVIGRLGYTGESTGPHLHLHVADANQTLGAEGIPYAFQHFKLLGVYPSIEAFDKGQAWLAPAELNGAERSAELPAPLAVVEFPDLGSK